MHPLTAPKINGCEVAQGLWVGKQTSYDRGLLLPEPPRLHDAVWDGHRIRKTTDTPPIGEAPTASLIVTQPRREGIPRTTSPPRHEAGPTYGRRNEGLPLS